MTEPRKPRQASWRELEVDGLLGSPEAAAL